MLAPQNIRPTRSISWWKTLRDRYNPPAPSDRCDVIAFAHRFYWIYLPAVKQ